MKTELLIVTVCYYNDVESVKYNLQLPAQVGESKLVRALVVNGVHDRAYVEQELSKLPDMLLLFPDKNLGYLGAFSLALDAYRNTYGGTPLLSILSNTDLRYDANQVLPQLMEAAQQKGVGLIGPAVYSLLSKHEQNPFLAVRMSERKIRFLISVYSYYPLYLAYQCMAYVKRLFTRTASLGERRSVYALHGAFIGLTKPFAESPELRLADAPFLFAEELYLAERCRLMGLATVFCPEVHIQHDEHSTTGLFKSKEKVRWMRESLISILALFYSQRS